MDFTHGVYEPMEDVNTTFSPAETSEEELECNIDHNIAPDTNNTRRSQRISRPPAHLVDYHCSTSKHWCGIVESKDSRESYS